MISQGNSRPPSRLQGHSPFEAWCVAGQRRPVALAHGLRRRGCTAVRCTPHRPAAPNRCNALSPARNVEYCTAPPRDAAARRRRPRDSSATSRYVTCSSVAELEAGYAATRYERRLNSRGLHCRGSRNSRRGTVGACSRGLRDDADGLKLGYRKCTRGAVRRACGDLESGSLSVVRSRGKVGGSLLKSAAAAGRRERGRRSRGSAGGDVAVAH